MCICWIDLVEASHLCDPTYCKNIIRLDTNSCSIAYFFEYVPLEGVVRLLIATVHTRDPDPDTRQELDSVAIR